MVQPASKRLVTEGTLESRMIERIGATLAAPAAQSAMSSKMEAMIDSIVEGIILDGLDSHTPGSTLGFTEYGSAFTTSDTANGAAVVGLVTTVEGAGRPAEISLFIPEIFHSVAGTKTIVALAYQKNGVYQGYLPVICGSTSPYTDQGTGPVNVKHQMVLTDGDDFTFYPLIKPAAAGTSTLNLSGVVRANLSVISR